MAQTKKKQSTKTAKKTTARGNTTRKKSCNRTCKKQQISQAEKYHVYAVTAMSMIAGILLCADAAMLMV